jgi:hypothetical protein
MLSAKDAAVNDVPCGNTFTVMNFSELRKAVSIDADVFIV